MLDEVIDFFRDRDPKLFVDCTFGAGGHSRALLSHFPNSRVVCIDRDISVLPYYKKIEEEFGKNRVNFFNVNFAKIREVIIAKDIGLVDGVIMDLGISSMQIDSGDRGFAFNNNALLDMRMDRSSSLTAHDVINKFSEHDLADIIYYYGEEPKAKKIAKSIVNFRNNRPIDTTFDLANIVRSCFKGVGKKPRMSDLSTKTFMAIRIYVNDELFEIENAINQFIELMSINARMVIITFNALEDRLVKRRFKEIEKNVNNSAFKIVTKNKLLPKKSEIEANYRSRSAGIRVLERVY